MTETAEQAVERLAREHLVIGDLTLREFGKACLLAGQQQGREVLTDALCQSWQFFVDLGAMTPEQVKRETARVMNVVAAALRRRGEEGSKP